MTTTKTKRQNVERLLDEHPEKTVRWIAERAKTTERYVQTIKAHRRAAEATL